MPNFLCDPQTLLSVATLITAVIALFLTHKQITLSNKHQLFDRRLKKYFELKTLISLYEDSRKLFTDSNGTLMTFDFHFAQLTNCAELHEINSAMERPLVQGEQIKLLSKVESLKKDAEEISLIWNGPQAKMASRFVEQFATLLMKMYQQQVYIKRLEKENEGDKFLGRPSLTDTEFQKKANNEAESLDLFTVLDSINATYKNIVEEKVLQKLADSLRL